MPSGTPAPFGPGRLLRGAPVYGGRPLRLPQVATLPASSLTNSSAYLNGSVNPEGLATSYWFAWGLTPQYGSTTSSTSAGSGTLPVTVGTTITGLTVGSTYHYAIVAQSAAGTVYGTDVTFVAAVPSTVPTATAALNPYGAPAVVTPHFEYPFTLTTTGALVVEQDSLLDVFSCAQAVVNCTTGACPELPDFGIPDVTFSDTPFDSAPIVRAISRWEPRAEVSTTVKDAPPLAQATSTGLVLGGGTILAGTTVLRGVTVAAGDTGVQVFIDMSTTGQAQ